MSKNLLINTNDMSIFEPRRYYQEYEGTFITATDKSEDDIIDTSRYIEVTEIWGNTVQDENNLEDIQSVGELYVDDEGNPILDELGREQYKVKISTDNGNLIQFDKLEFGSGIEIISDNTFKLIDATSNVRNIDFIGDFKSGETYTATMRCDSTNCDTFIGGIHNNGVWAGFNGFNKNTKRVSFKLTSDVKKIRFSCYIENVVFGDITLYKGDCPNITPRPYRQSHKTTILLPCQLQKVGDVYDRLYWDSEKGKYVVEKNICKRVIDGDYTWGATPSYYYVFSFFKEKPKSTIFIESQDMKCVNLGTLNLYIPLSKFTSKDECKNHFSSNNMSLYYQLTTSQLIETNITEKILLPCYSEKTHIFVNSTVDATMKVLVPYKEII